MKQNSFNYAPEEQTALSFAGLCVSYRKTEILHQIHTTVPAARITCLLGRNGSGKSTLLKAAAGLLPITSGNICIFNRPAASYGRKELARTLALLPQGQEIPDITVEQFVSCGRYPHTGFGSILSSSDRQQIKLAMAQTGVLNWRYRRLPELSGGERQNVCLAMVIAQDSGLILLDEPTTYLDIHRQFEFLELLRKLNQTGKSILMSLHDIGHALTYGHWIIVLKDGSVAASGTPETLYRSKVLEPLFHIGIRREELSGKSIYHILPSYFPD